MIIAVTATGPTLDDSVEIRFGRCAYFLVIDPDTMEFEAVPNPNISLGGGAGIQSAQLMAEKNVSVVLTGNCGPNAFKTFGAAGIQVITGVGGKVHEAVRQYKTGTLSGSSAPNVQSRFGTGMGGGRGMGMGKGMGRGMGMGAGRMVTESPPMPPIKQHSEEQEIKDLKALAKQMEQQLNAIRQRIAEFEGKHPSVSNEKK
ncbi:MAG: NifB/NifX family molybdenum-iron cluster-binding protein [Desulfobacterales bacterium]|nr:NifB/NifX family molybdenum-iron cluster-binding protein [Desulfobacterales bacterium]